jgi:two-component system CheB/CheR fusion protein
VTGFFRDPEAWQVLEQRIVAPLVQERPANSSIRIWVPGCSTGEEAYWIAMLIAERAEAARKQFDLKFFATDVAQGVLGAARAGIIPQASPRT